LHFVAAEAVIGRAVIAMELKTKINLFTTFRGGRKKEHRKKITVEIKQDEMLNSVLFLGKDAK
jgi:hypothetical protein